MAEYDSTTMMIVSAARALEDKKTILVGTGMPLAAAGLAKKTFAPDILMVFEAGGTGPDLPRLPLSVGETITFYQGIEAGGMDNVMSAAGRGFLDYAFLGGAQVDMYGNLNSTVIGPYDKPKVRLPGSGGANDAGSLAWRSIYIMRQDKQRFVPKLDFFTTPGYITGPGAREKVGLPARTGPYRVITPLGVLGFDDATKRMKLLAVNPGVSIQDVIDNTGFELLFADKIEQVAPPTDEELRILREEVDPVGLLSSKSK